MQRRPTAYAPVTHSAYRYSGALMCLTLAGLQLFLAEHRSVGLFWLCMSVGLGLRTVLRLRRPVHLLLLGAWVALAATLGWQAVRSAAREHAPHTVQLPEAPAGPLAEVRAGVRAGARAVQACQTLTRTFAAFL